MPNEKDPREEPLNDVARNIMVRSNYDPHFAALDERMRMETRLFLARLDAVHTHERMTANQCREAVEATAEALYGMAPARATLDELRCTECGKTLLPQWCYCPHCARPIPLSQAVAAGSTTCVCDPPLVHPACPEHGVAK